MLLLHSAELKQRRRAYNNYNNNIAMNSPDNVEESQTIQAPLPQPEEPKKWLERPWRRSILLLLIVVVAVVVVVVVLVLTKTIGGAPAATPAPSLTPEQVACNFIGQTSLTDCRTTLYVELDTFIRIGSTIPTEIGLLTQLTYLDLSSHELAGTIPSSIAELTRLVELSVMYNQLTGTIPSSISLLTALTLLNLGYNELTGTLPSSLSQLSLLNGLFMSRNQLSGTIPPSISKLTLLYELIFENNQLTGAIPSSMSNLTLLDSLAFNINQLTGTIPSSLCNHVTKLFIDCGEIECTCCRLYSDEGGTPC